MIQKGSARNNNQYILFENAAAVRQDSGEFIFQHCKTATAQRIGHGSFLTNILQGSVAKRLRRVGGIFNDHLNANFFAVCDSERILKICHSICRSFVLIIRVRGLLLWPTLFVSVTYIQ